MFYVACILFGIIAARWLLKPLAALLRALVFIVSIAVAYRLTMAVVPLQVDWRGFWGGAAIGLIVVLAVGALFSWRMVVNFLVNQDRARAHALVDANQDKRLL